MMMGRARIIPVVFILPRERQESVELQASEGILGSQGKMGPKGHQGDLESQARRYVSAECHQLWRAAALPQTG